MAYWNNNPAGCKILNTIKINVTIQNDLISNKKILYNVIKDIKTILKHYCSCCHALQYIIDDCRVSLSVISGIPVNWNNFKTIVSQKEKKNNQHSYFRDRLTDTHTHTHACIYTYMHPCCHL